MPSEVKNSGSREPHRDAPVAAHDGSPGLAREAMWLALGKVIRIAVTFITPVILTRHLSKADYGAFRQIDMIAAILGAVAVLGLERSVTNFVPRPECDAGEEASTALWAVLGLGVLLLGPLLLFPAALQAMFSLRPLYALVVAIVVTSVGEAVVTLTQRALIATGHGMSAAMTVAGLSVPYVAGIAVTVQLGGDLRALCVVVSLNAVLISVAMGCLLRRYGLLVFRFELRVLMRQFQYALPIWGIGLITLVGQRFDRLLIMTRMDEAAFAVYSTGLVAGPLTTILAGSLREVSAPRFARYDSSGERQRTAQLWSRGSELLLPLHVFMAGAQLFLAHLLIPLIYTEKFVAAVPVFMVSAAATVLGAFAGLELVARAMSAFRFLAVVTLGSAVVRILAGLAVLSLDSLALQAATQIAISYLQVGITLAFVRDKLGVSWADILPNRSLGASLLPVLLCGIGGYAIELQVGAWPLAARVAATGVVWGAGGVAVVYRLWRRRNEGEVVDTKEDVAL